ncbi:MAG: hypothetical protein FWC00_00185 [Firmicutes bacterium]|nr:hypothetical protein [Bacillota bacterium]
MDAGDIKLTHFGDGWAQIPKKTTITDKELEEYFQSLSPDKAQQMLEKITKIVSKKFGPSMGRSPQEGYEKALGRERKPAQMSEA